VLQYLVTSKVRRRLLALLWGEDACGSVAELAERAAVSPSNAYGELKEMERLQLVVSHHEGRKEVFAANAAHPEATLLRALVASDQSPPTSAATEGDEDLKRSLVSLGAPLRGFARLPVPEAERLAVLVKGVTLARRDATVARALPICFWYSRDALDARALAALAPRAEDRHALGFFLELAAELGGDRRLLGLAETLRDRRMTSVREFFQSPSARKSTAREFPLATKWGFQMNMDLESFRSLFDKFVKRD
jgi:helix-turn-helix protein